MDVLRTERLQRGWSQARLAPLLGTDAGTISRWERGRTMTTPMMREQLCTLYGRTAAELGFIDPPAASSPVSLSDRGAPPPPDDHPTAEERDIPTALAEPAMTPTGITGQDRLLGTLAYAVGWVSGLFVAGFCSGRPFARAHGIRAVIVFGPLHGFIFWGAAVASRDAAGGGGAVASVATVAAPLAFLAGIIAWLLSMRSAARGVPALQQSRIAITDSAMRRIPRSPTNQ